MRTWSFLSSSLIFAFALVISQSATAAFPPHAYYPVEFYSLLENGLKDDALKTELFHILSQVHVHDAHGGSDSLAQHCPSGAHCEEHLSLGYNQARRHMFGDIHLQRTNKGYAIYDVYCQTMNYAQDFHQSPPGPMEIPDSAVLNAEHTWPQSHFTHKFPTDLQKSDLNILYPVNSNANSSRGNLDFTNVVTETTSPCAAARRGYSNDGTGSQYFEPPAAHKGNVARAIFYFAVRYQMHVPAEEQASLRAWNHDDPPDDFERTRNDKVEAAQGNRNPFIDYPELIDRISKF
jgi:hypothetical protein